MAWGRWRDVIAAGRAHAPGLPRCARPAPATWIDGDGVGISSCVALSVLRRESVGMAWKLRRVTIAAGRAHSPGLPRCARPAPATWTGGDGLEILSCVGLLSSALDSPSAECPARSYVGG